MKRTTPYNSNSYSNGTVSEVISDARISTWAVSICILYCIRCFSRQRQLSPFLSFQGVVRALDKRLRYSTFVQSWKIHFLIHLNYERQSNISARWEKMLRAQASQVADLLGRLNSEMGNNRGEIKPLFTDDASPKLLCSVYHLQIPSCLFLMNLRGFPQLLVPPFFIVIQNPFFPMLSRELCVSSSAYQVSNKLRIAILNPNRISKDQRMYALSARRPTQSEVNLIQGYYPAWRQRCSVPTDRLLPPLSLLFPNLETTHHCTHNIAELPSTSWAIWDI